MSLIEGLVQGLRSIHEFPDIYVACEPKNRRSSVAIIIRFANWQPGPYSSLAELLDSVPNDAIPEILFIKRAANERDRWSSHIALPGGRNDNGELDIDTAVRETSEEVGLDLTTDGVYVGPLDQRLLKVSWGSKAIMTLCPFVFILTRPDAHVTLQEKEVATAFWHPLFELVNPHHRAHELVDVTSRLNLESYPQIPAFARPWIRANVGKMTFNAVDLHPTTLLHLSNGRPLDPPPYKLWGVSLAVLTDFLALTTSGVTASSISPPGLQHWDMRILLYLFSYRYLRSKRQAIDTVLNGPGCIAGSMDLVNKVLDGYYAYPRRAIMTAVAIRTAAAVSVFCTVLYKAINRRVSP